MTGAPEINTPPRMPKALKRLLSALLMAPLALFLLLYHPLSLLVVLILAFCVAGYEWWGFVRAAPRRKKRIALAGLIYIPICFFSFADIRAMQPDGAFFILTLLLSVWASDTGAYLLGRAIGGPKWIPSISPNKTWAGVAGAMIGSGGALLLIMACAPTLMGTFHHRIYLDQYGILPIFGFGLLLGFVCQIGDVFISVFKRRAGLKDTGYFIPGHGGLLDRIDSLMLGSVFTLIVLKILTLGG